MDNYQLNPSISVSTYQKTIVIVEFIVILLDSKNIEKRCIKNKDNKESLNNYVKAVYMVEIGSYPKSFYGSAPA